jgi:general secretion pathway protein K
MGPEKTAVIERRRGRQRGGHRGFALPVVLLVLAVMSALALRMVEESQSSIAVARARLEEATARSAADAGYEMFLVRYAAAPDRSELPGFDVAFGRARIEVRAEDESGKIDLNIGVPLLVKGILLVVGAEEHRAEAISQEIMIFRGGGGIFHSVDELIRIAGMDIDLLERVRPYVTVYFAAPGIDPRTARREVLMAVPDMTEAKVDRIIAARAGEAALEREERVSLRAFRSRGRPVVSVLSTATLSGGERFAREAVVDLSDPGAPVVLAWGRANAAPAAAGGSE